MFYTLDTSLVAPPHRAAVLRVMVITSQPRMPPHVPLAHEAEK